MLEQILKILSKYGYVYWNGFVGTLWISAVTVFFATIVGTLIAIARMSKLKVLNAVLNVYIEVLRGTPILLQLYFFWIFLPKYMPFELSDLQCIIVALIVNASSYVAEIIRAGIQAVDIGQTEAALSLGLSRRNMMTKVILPQAIRNILPALGNEFISMIKQASLSSTFFVAELTTSFRTVQSITFMAIPALMISGSIYLALTFTLSRLVGLFERRLQAYER